MAIQRLRQQQAHGRARDDNGQQRPDGPQGNKVTSGVNLRFPGQYCDDESLLCYNGWRFYQPSGDGFTQMDPTGLQGGPNRRIYGNADALSHIDPDGRIAFVPIMYWAAAAGAAAWATWMSTPSGQQAASDVARKIVDLCSPGDPGGPGEPDPCKGLRDQLSTHEKKLDEFLNDPLGPSDNTNILKWAYLANNGGWASSIYEGRIRNLRGQIDNFRRLLKECEQKNGR
jgi:RHS repeat-associated protein